MQRLGVSLSLSLVASVATAQAVAQDAAARLQADLSPRLRKHAFFGHVDFTTVTKHPPFVFYVQRPPQDDPEYSRRVINSYLPFLLELGRVFEAEYGKPKAAGPASDPAYAIAILASRGNYDDFARSIADRSLHMARAHYDSDLRLAITHQVLFGSPDPRDERESLLHELVHAMQHAYGSTGAMTRPVWFNEGLAEYRSSCTNLASTLRDPPLRDRNVSAMAFGYAHPLGKAYVLPLADLVVPESYQQVLEVMQKAGGATLKPEVALSMFYAQAEMTVRFLHEAEQGKYRAGFQRYFEAVEQGASGLAAFQEAFDAKTSEAMAAMEQDWLRWLSGILQTRFEGIGDIASGQPGSARVPLPPPADFDRASLAWQPDDRQERVGAARRLCAKGRYEEALMALPEAGDLPDMQKGLLQRERDRVQGVLTVREAVIADLEKRKGVVRLETASGPVRGKLVRREDDAAVLLVGRAEQRVPWSDFGPDVLLKYGRKLKQFERSKRALEAFLLWLGGKEHDDRELKRLLELGYQTILDLRKDLAADLDEEYGAAAVALLDLQQLALPDEPAAARAALTEFEDIVHRHGSHPLLQHRKAAIEQMARALAERAFMLDDAEAMGIRAQVEKLDGQRVRLRYADPKLAPNAGFSPVSAEELQLVQATRIAYDGPTELAAAGDHWRLIGSGFLRWSMPLAGAQEVELEFEVTGSQGIFSVILCREEGRWLQVTPAGQISIWDESLRIDDQVGKPAQVFIDHLHRLRVVHDGKKRLQAFVDGKSVATLPNVGNCLRGDLLLLVRSSEAIEIKSLVITGKLDPQDPLPLRDRCVEDVLQRLWR